MKHAHRIYSVVPKNHLSLEVIPLNIDPKNGVPTENYS